MPNATVQPASEQTVAEICRVLDAYQLANPGSAITAYQHHPFSVRLRVVDPGFKAMGRFERLQRVWEYLGQLPAEILTLIGLVVCDTPKELAKSHLNRKFEERVPYDI